MSFAIISLPVPLSPSINTGMLAPATLSSFCRTTLITSERPNTTSSGGTVRLTSPLKRVELGRVIVPTATPSRTESFTSTLRNRTYLHTENQRRTLRTGIFHITANPSQLHIHDNLTMVLLLRQRALYEHCALVLT